MTADIRFHFLQVKELTAFSATECAEKMPEDVFPFFLGSRVLALGLTPPACKALTLTRQIIRSISRYTGAMLGSMTISYIFHSAMKSNHASRDETLLRMPMGGSTTRSSSRAIIRYRSTTRAGTRLEPCVSTGHVVGGHVLHPGPAAYPHYRLFA